MIMKTWLLVLTVVLSTLIVRNIIVKFWTHLEYTYGTPGEWTQVTTKEELQGMPRELKHVLNAFHETTNT